MSENSDSGLGSLGASLQLGRADMYLRRGDFDNAKSYYEEVIKSDPSNAKAYLGLLMVDVGVTQPEALAEDIEELKSNEYYTKLVECGGKDLIPSAEAMRAAAATAANDAALEEKYNSAVRIMNRARYAQDYATAASIFITIKNYKNSADLYSECNEKATEADRFATYKEAKMKIGSDSEEVLISAIQQLESIAGWSDADNLKSQASERLREIRAKRAEEENLVLKQKRKEKRAVAITIPLVLVVIAGIILCIVYVVPSLKYKKAVGLKDDAKYMEAADAFRNLGDYKDSVNMVDACKYKEAERLLEAGQYQDAIDLFYSIGGYGDAAIQAINCEKSIAKQDALLRAQSQINRLSGSAVGDSIELGDYEWTVLAIEDGKALVLADSVVDIKPYNDEFGSVTWEECSLRKWLNGEFYSSFNKEIKDRIQQTELTNPDNATYSTKGGANTTDFVFIFSNTDVGEYLGNGNAKTSDMWWWMRTPGQYDSYASRVSSEGKIYLDGDYVSALCGVRPAMWISIE